MSEYQYYEFRAIDRPLNDEELEELRALSTRAEITSTSFTNEYQYGSFKGDPSELMDRYFDAFVYIANWGTHRFMLRIPRGFVDVDRFKKYCDGEVVSLTIEKKHIVLEFSTNDEEGEGWVEGEHWMASLIPVRDELMRGDLRALYLGWLAALSAPYRTEDDPDEREPPVPPGLAKLSAPLQSLADFLRVDEELLEVAAAASTGEAAAAPSRTEFERWVKALPSAEKDAYLVRFLAGESDVVLRAELSKAFREWAAPQATGDQPVAKRRTVAELLAARDRLAEERIRKANERAAEAEARRKLEKEKARTRYLDELAKREPAAWREVSQFIAMKRPNDYDRAVELLLDLRELAERTGRLKEVSARIGELRQQHKNKPSLIERFRKNNLGV